jgi:hypothetical protein
MALVSTCVQIRTKAFAQHPDAPRLEIGPQLTQIYFPLRPVGSVQYQLGYGLVFSGNLLRRFGADAGFCVTPTAPISGTTFAGGRLTEAFFGARVGIFRARHFEFYGKVRPGFVHFNDVILHATSDPTLQFQTGSLTEPALDVGGIAMLRVSKRIGIRYEIGDTIIHYGGRIIDPSQPAVPPRLVNALQLGVALVVGF